jgi:hypothetical protein
MILALSVLASTASATIVNVPGDEPTVQAGIDAASFFDTVLVAPGTYVENVFINGSGILLASHFMLDGDPSHIAATILDGSAPSSTDTGSVIIMVNATATVQGFTITGGTGTAWKDQSDGLVYREGGGILTEGGNPVICNNVLIDNRANDKSGGLRSAGGGAIRCGFGSSALILNNIIAYNQGLYGGGIVAFHNNVTIRNNLIYRNSGGQDFGGGGIWITSSTSPNIVENNTIVENTSAFDAGGLLAWLNLVVVRNCIFWGNRATYGDQMKNRSAGTLDVGFCDVEGGWTGTGNIDLTPSFDGPNLLLGAGSPCIDAGVPDAPYYDPEDPGNPGAALWPSRGLLHSDIGAFGGPGCMDLPAFNAPGIQLGLDSADLGTLDVGASQTIMVAFEKHAYGWLQIDSVSYPAAWAGDFSSATSYPIALGIAPTDSLDSVAVSWQPSTYGELADTLWIHHSDALVPSPLPVVITGQVNGATGDPNLDGIMNASDIIYLVNYAFKGGPTPLPVPRSGDVNCDGLVTSTDVIFMVNFVFKSGPEPCL